jgi:methionyl aminopeptidase
LFETVKFW